MVTAAARVIEDEDRGDVRPTQFTNDIGNTRHTLSKRSPVFPFIPFGPKLVKKSIKFGPKFVKKSLISSPFLLKKTVKLAGPVAVKKSPFLLLKKKSVKPLLGPLAVKAAIKGPKEAILLGGGPLALSALGGGGNFDQENIRLTLLRFRNGLPTVGNPLS